MALRQSASALHAGFCRQLARLGQLGGLTATGRDEEQSPQVPQAQLISSFAGTARAHSLLAQHSMASTVQPQMGAQLVSTMMRMSAMPRMSLTSQQPQGSMGGMLSQRRHFNAYSPAQRYFVEGDHVIQAEANRTLQFTGLDAGSFYPFLLYTAVATGIAAAFMVIPFVVAPSRVDLDKSSAYECGFDAFGEARQTFSVSFYLVSIMYLLFDIEIAYLFPYVMSHANAPMFWTMNAFLGILVAGFVYEWGVGALEWRDSEAEVK